MWNWRLLGSWMTSLHMRLFPTAQVRIPSITCKKFINTFSGDYALIAAYTISKQIRVYQLWINWNLPGPQNKQAPIYPANPVVTVRRVKIIPSVRPPNPPLSSQESRLVHLEVFGPSPAGQTVRLNPMIACVFAGKTENQEHYSIISRWDLQTTPHALHPNFEQLHVRRGSIASPGLIEVRLRCDRLANSRLTLVV